MYPFRRRWALDAVRCARGLSEWTRPRRAASRPVASREAKRVAGPARRRSFHARSLAGAPRAAPPAGSGSLRQHQLPGEGRGRAEAATSALSRGRHSTQSLPARRLEPARRLAAAAQPLSASRPEPAPEPDPARAEARQSTSALPRPPGQPVPPQEPRQAREAPAHRKPPDLGRREWKGQDSKATALPARAAPRAPGPVAWPEAGRADRHTLGLPPFDGYRGRRTARRRRAHRWVPRCRPPNPRRRRPCARLRSTRDGRE